ncbi:hypothetical protein Dimus_034985 [Dionaea muscipula]
MNMMADPSHYLRRKNNPSPFSPPPPPFDSPPPSSSTMIVIPPPHTPPLRPPPQPPSLIAVHISPTIQLSNTASSSLSGGGGAASPTTGKHPLYRGVRCRGGKWVTEIREPRKTTRIWLGTFQTPEMAAAAYDVAAMALKGKEAVLNFPQAVGRYPVPASTSPGDIRAAALAAAAMREKHDIGLTTAEEEEEQVEQEEEEEIMAGPPWIEFVDEEPLFDMPMANLLVDMAEGLLVSPPRISSPDDRDDSQENYGGASGGGGGGDNLWSYNAYAYN